MLTPHSSLLPRTVLKNSTSPSGQRSLCQNSESTKIDRADVTREHAHAIASSPAYRWQRGLQARPAAAWCIQRAVQKQAPEGKLALQAQQRLEGDVSNTSTRPSSAHTKPEDASHKGNDARVGLPVAGNPSCHRNIHWEQQSGAREARQGVCV